MHGTRLHVRVRDILTCICTCIEDLHCESKKRHVCTRRSVYYIVYVCILECGARDGWWGWRWRGGGGLMSGCTLVCGEA